MSTTIVREFADIGISASKYIQAPAEPKLADQVITTSAASAGSSAFTANTRLIGISTPVSNAVAYEVSATPGATPTATTSHQRLPANSIVYIGVRPGDKIAFIEVP